jgi:hypothetical protein
MHKKFHIFFIMLLLGAFLLPSVTFACETTSEKACCKKEVPAKSEKKKCCKDSSSKKEDKGCNGKCGHSNCTSAAVHSVFAVFTDVEFNGNLFDFSSEKQNFYHTKTFISSGFSSLWLIPKIG